ncbi:MAG: aminotransferase class I/II-fold pyridoxal phosphate-dependent enzyme [Candidatus Melainabacteria bacterium]|nr:aminotransferase class I/II-fold pyridoxal phosphate-dependent enzyme [Candidatus Melainabacteria bacterium]
MTAVMTPMTVENCFIRPKRVVERLKAYTPPLEGRRNKIRLDFNENTVGFPAVWPSPWDVTLMTTYPEYGDFSLRLARQLQIHPETLLLTNGSDEALNVIASTFTEPAEDAALISKPSFPLIGHYLRLADANVVEVMATSEFEYDLPALDSALQQQRYKMAIFASPDNPTGALMPVQQVLRWCQQYPETLFVMDEAYSAYVSADQTVLPYVATTPNLMVTRTFSKAWGLAGLRLGYVVAHPQLVDYMKRVRSPYSVNTVAVHAANQLLERESEVVSEALATMERKTHLVQAVRSRGYRVYEGHANFFLMAAGVHTGALEDACLQEQVLVRDRSTAPGLQGLVRVSVGTEPENQAFIKALDRFKQSQALIFDLDDTLVDTRQSFDAVVMALVARYSATPLTLDELTALRAEGGFNDDWQATVELLHRRGVSVSYAAIAEEAEALYHQKARAVERLLLDPELLRQWASRYRLFILTGRSRSEYEPVWAERLDALFEAVYCADDFPGMSRKPAPDMLNSLMIRHQIEGGCYIGNSVDDMRAAKAAGLFAVGIAYTHPADILQQAGADAVLDTVADVWSLFDR